MFESLENGIGLDIVLWFQHNRSGWMEVLAQILDLLGEELGYVAILGLIVWLINKRHGIRMIFALVAVALVTFALKDIFARERPFVVSQLVTPLFETEGFGLPSGHTAFAVMILGYVALWQRKAWVWLVAILYMILQGAGRLVAGVHYPQDIVLGAIVGAVTLAIYYPATERWEAFWNGQALAMKMLIAIVIPLVIAAIVMFLPLDPFQIEAYLSIIGIALGAGIGAAIEGATIQFEPPQAIAQKAIVFVIGAVITLLILLGLSPVFDGIAETGTVAYMLRIVRYSLGAYIALAVIPVIAIRANLMTSNLPEKTTSAEA